MKDRLRTIDLNDLHLSEIIVARMLDYLTPDQIDRAKDIFVERIVCGEGDLRTLFRSVGKKLLGTDNPTIISVKNQWEYLAAIYNNRPRAFDNKLSVLESSLMREYAQLSSDPMRGGYGKGISNMSSFLEIAFNQGDKTTDTQNLRKISYVIVRRKDTKRAIEKIAGRLVKFEINEESKNGFVTKELIEVPIHDWFGMKIVVPSKGQAYAVLDSVLGKLHQINFEQEATREEAKYDKLNQKDVSVLQLPGIDDHYKYGSGKDHSLQLRVRPKESIRIRELLITDFVNFLKDEKEHVAYMPCRQRKLEKCLGQRRSYQQRYDEYVGRAMELDERLPRQRIRVLAPGKYF